MCEQPQWPGYIFRQDLVIFARKHSAEISVENNKIYAAMQNKGISDEDYEALFAKHCSNLGEVLGIRKMFDFVRDSLKTQEELEAMESK